jgi:hypothetical protein
MSGSALRSEECCNWCHRPATRCLDSSCDDAGTYTGVLLRGEWVEVEAGGSTSYNEQGALALAGR